MNHPERPSRKKAPPPAPLILLGVVHQDPEGYKHLFSLLSSLQPDRLTVEISAASLYRRCRSARAWRRMLLARLDQTSPPGFHWPFWLKSLWLSLGLPFEWRASFDYAQLHGLPTPLPLDLSGPARERLPLIPLELLHPDNLHQLHQKNLPAPPTEGLYQRARAALKQQRELPLDSSTRDELNRRDLFMARRLKSLVPYATPEHPLVHIGGWQHLLPRNHSSLADLLAPFSPSLLLVDPLTLSQDPGPKGETDHPFQPRQALPT